MFSCVFSPFGECDLCETRVDGGAVAVRGAETVGAHASVGLKSLSLHLFQLFQSFKNTAFVMYPFLTDWFTTVNTARRCFKRCPSKAVDRQHKLDRVQQVARCLRGLESASFWKELQH